MRRRLIAATLASSLLAGCSLGLESLPAPAGVSGPTYHITAQFGDVQNLTEGAKVKLGGVVVGEVTSITTRDYHANVGMNIAQKFDRLGTDAKFQIRFTTPLGEDYVSIVSSGHPARGVLKPGAIVGVSSGNTTDAPSIEDTFSAVSTLLNGGGLAKLKTIATELDTAFHNRTGDARDLLIKLQQVIGNLDAHKDDIDKVLDGLHAMADALNRGTGIVEQALDVFPPAIQAVTRDTAQVRTLITKVATLGRTVKSLLDRGQANLLTDLDELRPTLDALRARESQLQPTFQSLITFGKLLNRAAPGDYINLDVTVNFLLNSPPARPHDPGPSADESGAALTATPYTTPAAGTSSAAITQLLGGGVR